MAKKAIDKTNLFREMQSVRDPASFARRPRQIAEQGA
jgi:hypothetical protein